MINTTADMFRALTRKSGNKPLWSGLILFEGPSAIDGAPIVVIANRIANASTNAKTGALAQTFIIRADMHPMDAIRTGQDASICGDCPMRPYAGGKCYVDVAKSVRSVFDAYKRGRYARPGVDYDAKILPTLFAGLAVRVGAYGDPAAAPFQIWRAITMHAAKVTGYSHQWRNPRFAAFRLLCMASCETVEAASIARAMGWRTFRTKAMGAPNTEAEIGCPAAKENGARTTCDKCGLCNGATSKSPKSIAIELHGPRAPRRIAA